MQHEFAKHANYFVKLIAVAGTAVLAASLAAQQYGPEAETSDTGFWTYMLIVVLLGMLYFFPSIVARKKRNLGAIFALNLLLGWTLLGWVVAFVWALTKDPAGSTGGGQPPSE